MNDKSQVAGSTVSARRRLIRGVFATPAVFTLCSGGALAQTTSRLSCIIKANTPPTPAPAVADVTGSWLRVQLVRDNDPPRKYFVLGERLPLPRLASLPTNLQWQEFNIGTTGSNANQLTGPISLAPASSTYSDVPIYAALRVDQTGTVVSVGNTNALGSAIGTSCWNSFTKV